MDSPLRHDTINDQDPQQFYQMLQEIGRGAYGSVHKAIYKPTGETVAIKIVLKNQEAVALQKQITILEESKSDYIVKYYGSYSKGEYLWIVMEYCAAGSIGDLIRICERELREEEIASILQAILRGLEYLHNNKKIHRDVKAGNILLDQKGNAKLADFGVSAEISTYSKRDTVIGSPYWMSPEMLGESKYDQKTDIWSLGITSIELAEGAAPYSNIHPFRAMFVIKKNPTQQLNQKNKWSEQFQDLVKCCLKLKASQRPTATQLLSHPFITKKSRGKAILAQLFCNSIDDIQKMRVKQSKKKHNHQNENSLQMKFIEENKNSIKPETNSIRSYSNVEEEEEDCGSSGTLVINDSLKEPPADSVFVKFAKQMNEADMIYSNKAEVNNMIDNFQVKKEETEEDIRERIRHHDQECSREMNEVLQKYRNLINQEVITLKKLHNKSINRNEIRTFQMDFQNQEAQPGNFKGVKNINNINSINISIGDKAEGAKNACSNCGNVEKSETVEAVVQEGFKKAKKYQQFIEDPQVLQYLKKTYLRKKAD